jgi:protein-S-isoprenylcysteine O-methyltransferase Ste14
LSAMGLAVLCLALSIWCWLHMGRDWRMGVDTSGATRLITDGPFAKVRHPIYTLSICMMVCSVVVVQTVLMVVVAVAHIVLMHAKARNEEAFLTRTHGETSTIYQSRTGRFLPRWR